MQDDYSDLDQRIQSFRYSDAQRDDLLAGLVQRLRSLEQSHKDLLRDYENERNSRRHWQDQYEVIDRQLVTNRHAAEVNCFVQVLIDGDASYFHESFIEGGEKGGARASAELHSVVKKHIDTMFPGSDLPIMLHMYANLGGLSGLYVRNGVIPSPSQLFVFARGFNSSYDMFNLVDVGKGKEGADHKIREMLRMFMTNKQCKHIIFGGLHDNGYLNILRPLAHDPEKRQRITLLETLPAQPGFKELDYTIITIPSVFKLEQPKIAPAMTTATEPSIATLSIRSPSPATSVTQAPTSWSAKVAINGKAATSSMVATNGKDPANVLATKPKQVRYILQNTDKCRIDERLPTVPSAIYESLKKKREQHGNLCNDHYLKGSCPNEALCNYSHGFKLSVGEINALKLLARNLVCPDLSYCEDFSCYKGHNCSYGIKRCNKGEQCYFYKTHGISNQPTIKLYEDGRRETST